MKRLIPGPGQESVWDYPRPPKLELSSRQVKVFFQGELIAQSIRAYRVLETSHPPTWYIPPEDIQMGLLQRSVKQSFCEWKGAATYWSLGVDHQNVQNVAWSYEQPSTPFLPIRGYLAFYPSKFECYVDNEPVEAQPGDFYGGWITKDIVGPFKGGPGSWGW
jgi:uncharacterized protein (DUF427 family)